MDLMLQMKNAFFFFRKAESEIRIHMKNLILLFPTECIRKDTVHMSRHFICVNQP